MQSMWKIPDVSKIETPVAIMRAQADALTNLSDGLLLGTVDATGSGSDIKYEFKIIVPNLNRYTFSVVLYNQKITALFEGMMYSYASAKRYQVTNLQNFTAYLEEVLGSPEVTNVVASLLAQARN